MSKCKTSKSFPPKRIQVVVVNKALFDMIIWVIYMIAISFITESKQKETFENMFNYFVTYFQYTHLQMIFILQHHFVCYKPSQLLSCKFHYNVKFCKWVDVFVNIRGLWFWLYFGGVKKYKILSPMLFSHHSCT
jgi:hypothetical protein